MHGTGNGDERVTVKVQTPKSLNKQQKIALKAFAEASGDEVADEGNFLDRLVKALKNE